jgi:hypothetical protein
MVDAEVNYESQVSYHDRYPTTHDQAPSHMRSCSRTRSWVYTTDISLGRELAKWKLKSCGRFSPSEVAV